jgi:pyruvate kinase
LLDTKGPEIRTGFFNEKCKGKIHLKARAARGPAPAPAP